MKTNILICLIVSFILGDEIKESPKWVISPSEKKVIKNQESIVPINEIHSLLPEKTKDEIAQLSVSEQAMLLYVGITKNQRKPTIAEDEIFTKIFTDERDKAKVYSAMVISTYKSIPECADLFLELVDTNSFYEYKGAIEIILQLFQKANLEEKIYLKNLYINKFENELFNEKLNKYDNQKLISLNNYLINAQNQINPNLLADTTPQTTQPTKQTTQETTPQQITTDSTEEKTTNWIIYLLAAVVLLIILIVLKLKKKG